MKTNHPSCPVHETIDLLPEVLQLIDRRLHDIYRDDPQTLTYRSIQLDLHKLTGYLSTADVDATAIYQTFCAYFGQLNYSERNFRKYR